MFFSDCCTYTARNAFQIRRITNKLPPSFNQTEISDSNLLYIGFEKKTVQKLSRVLTWMPHTCTEARYYELASDIPSWLQPMKKRYFENLTVISWVLNGCRSLIIIFYHHQSWSHPWSLSVVSESEVSNFVTLV